MPTVSLCMIVKDEEDVLRRCLQSVCGAVDEIIIVDTGSTDRTKEIAFKFTDSVFDFNWIDDFSAARNYSFSLAKSDYILWLDADDVLEEGGADKLLALKQTLTPDIGVVFMKYHAGFDTNGEPNFSYYRERILRNCPLALWQEPVHEAIVPFGKTIYSDIAVLHKKEKQPTAGRNLKIMQSHVKKGKNVSARFRYYYARELMFNGKMKEACEQFETFLDLPDAWFENKIGACHDLYRCKKAVLGVSDAELLFKSFVYGAPRAETLCELGQYFLEKSDLTSAAYWYESALNLKPDSTQLGFCETDFYNFIPLLQLCVIYDRLGNKKLAEQFNRQASAIKPEHPSCLHNAQYFAKISN